jgi:hypothetical protein
MTNLIETKAPRGKFRVVADNYGKWAARHSDILVGDFDTIQQARDAARPAQRRPRHEHWSVMSFNDEGKML